MVLSTNFYKLAKSILKKRKFLSEQEREAIINTYVNTTIVCELILTILIGFLVSVGIVWSLFAVFH
jgi:hypothetical protein